MPVFTHVVPEDSPMMRMDAYCYSVFAIFSSRNQARKAIKAASLFIDESRPVPIGFLGLVLN
jgi:hypothetical protein